MMRCESSSNSLNERPNDANDATLLFYVVRVGGAQDQKRGLQRRCGTAAEKDLENVGGRWFFV